MEHISIALFRDIYGDNEAELGGNRLEPINRDFGFLGNLFGRGRGRGGGRGGGRSRSRPTPASNSYGGGFAGRARCFNARRAQGRGIAGC